MKNLSLQTMQATPLKSTTESSGKGDLGVGNVESGNAKSAFQMTLSNQVQAKQSQAKQNQNKPVQEAKSGSVKDVAESPQVQSGAADQLVAKLQAQVKTHKAEHTGQVHDAVQIGLEETSEGVQFVSAESIALLANELVSKEQPATDQDIKVEGLPNVSAEADAQVMASIAAMMMAPLANSLTQPLATKQDLANAEVADTMQTPSGLEPLSDKLLPASAADRAQAKQSSDVALNNVLSVSKI